MLRGMTGSSVPATGTLVFDIPKPQSLCVVKDASGGMMSADGVIARDQVMADISGRFSVRESTDSGSGKRLHSHDSQSLTLHANREQFTPGAFPCPPGRGPIEAR